MGTDDLLQVCVLAGQSPHIEQQPSTQQVCIAEQLAVLAVQGRLADLHS